MPIALGLVVGGLAGTVNVIRGQGEIYFDSLTMLVLLLLVGRWIQRRQQRWAGDAVELLFALTPSSARRVEGDEIREVPLEAIRRGDVVEVRAGDSVPTDGVVLEGVSQVDQSLLTGESRPVSVRPGDTLHAATVNLSSRIRVQVAAVGDETRVGRLLRLVEECSRRQAPIVQKADRLAGRFVLVVIVLAVLTYGLWWWLDAPRALDRAIALLIVCCPCALGLATPLAVSVALGRAAARRILIKGGETLELLAGTGTIVLDKTGTITAGRTAVVTWAGDERYQPLAAALEEHSAHPIARALVASYADRVAGDRRASRAGNHGGRHRGERGGPQHGGRLAEVRAVAADHRAGVPGKSRTPCRDLGSRRRFWWPPTGFAWQWPVWAIRSATTCRRPSRTWGDWVGTCRFCPATIPASLRRSEMLWAFPRSTAGEERRRRRNWRTFKRASQDHCVVMVGDGVNDAAALAAATVGVAVQGGAEASLAAADVYLNRPGLMPVVELMQAARTTLRAIHRSLAASLGYNVLAAGLVIAGWIGPLGAAVLMPISSFTVLAMAFAVRTFEGRT